jgi:hypothetical protein
MQYILTEKEYHELKTKQENELKEKQNIINKLCTEICNLKEVEFHWTDDKQMGIWGCIYSRKGEHYCDECPTQEYCTKSKNWSK